MRWRLAAVLGLIAFLTRPQQLPDSDYFRMLVLRYFSLDLDWSNGSIGVSPQMEVYDATLFMWVTISSPQPYHNRHTPQNKHYFIGLFGNWIPVPSYLISPVLDTADRIFGRCEYRGVNLGGDCLCLPSWTSRSKCRNRITGLMPLSKYSALKPYLPDVLANWTVLEIILIILFTIYILWNTVGELNPGLMYRFTTLNGGQINLFSYTPVSMLLSHFSHRHILHFLWALYGFWSTLVPAYVELGGKAFLATLAFGIAFISILKLSSDLLRGDRRRSSPSLYGLQYLLVFFNTLFLLSELSGYTSRRLPFISRILRAPPDAVANFLRSLGRYMLQVLMFEQFSTGGVNMYMDFASMFAALVYSILLT